MGLKQDSNKSVCIRIDDILGHVFNTAWDMFLFQL